MAIRRLFNSTFSRPASLVFGAATGDRVTMVGASDISGFPNFSFGLVLKATTLTANNVIASKSNDTTRGWQLYIVNATGDVGLFLFGSVSSLEYDTSGGPIHLNKWQYVVATIDTALGAALKIRFYISADLGSPLVEVPKTVVGEGSSLVVDTAADTLNWSNIAASTLAFQGNIALAWYAPGTVYSLQNLQAWRNNPLRPFRDMKVFTVLDRASGGPLYDQTGNGHYATVT